MISSAAVFGRCALNSSHWSGKSVKAIMPWVIELRVVSLPATVRVTTNIPNSASVSWPSASASTSVLTMSSPGFSAFCAANCMAYQINSAVEPSGSYSANSGSSAPIIWLVQSNSLLRSSSGTPSSPAMACSGSSRATCRTKSPAPSCAASAAMRCARSPSSARNRSTARGVNPREMILRSRVCSGSSIMIIDAARLRSGPPTVTARSGARPTSCCRREHVAAQ